MDGRYVRLCGETHSAMRKRAIAQCLCVACAALGGCGDPLKDYEPYRRHGEGAAASLAVDGRISIPQHSTEHYYFHTGFAGSHTYYWSMKCRSVSDCYDAVSKNAPRDRFVDFRGSKRRMIAEGPAYFDPKYADPAWQVSKIGRAVAWEFARERTYEMCIIDLESCRVLYCKWTGSYPHDGETPTSVE
jgi:hypothetical protein